MRDDLFAAEGQQWIAATRNSTNSGVASKQVKASKHARMFGGGAISVHFNPSIHAILRHGLAHLEPKSSR
jgi:hypothetical protein